jgi:hypothetical protein
MPSVLKFLASDINERQLLKQKWKNQSGSEVKLEVYRVFVRKVTYITIFCLSLHRTYEEYH